MAMASNREYFTVKAVATYEAQPISIRAGLTPAEASAVHTVFCEWGDMGMPSLSRYQQECESAARMATTADPPKSLRRLVKGKRPPPRQTREQRWARQDAELEAMWHTIDVPADAPVAYPAGHVYAPERWLGEPWDRKSRERRDRVRQAWEALRQLDGECVSTLFLLYGHAPPGMPTPGTFSAGVDADYRRVVRLLPGGSTAEMADRTRVDRAVHDGETAVGYRMRVARAEGDVAEVVREVARKCEALVRKAVGAYRAAVARGAER